jgi:hypothetical protein
MPLGGTPRAEARGLKFGHFERQFPWLPLTRPRGHPLPKGEGESHA